MNTPGPTVHCTIQHGYYVLHLAGADRLAEDEAAILDSSIRKIMAKVDSPRVAVSLQDVKLVSTGTFGKLMVLQQEISRQGGRLALVDVNSEVMEALENMKIAELLNVRETADQLVEPEEGAENGQMELIENAEEDEEDGDAEKDKDDVSWLEDAEEDR